MIRNLCTNYKQGQQITLKNKYESISVYRLLFLCGFIDPVRKYKEIILSDSCGQSLLFGSLNV